MPNLTENIINRVRKLPKPSNYSQAMQPVFEAISNALYAIEDKREINPQFRGRVDIRVWNLSRSSKIQIEVIDNGIGLDEARFDAFSEIDTAFKQKKGGKGVGRLFWLDAFSSIKVDSVYIEGGLRQQRSFIFQLSPKEQIALTEEYEFPEDHETGTKVSFFALRNGEYSQHFPKQADAFLRYFSAHFIADFLLGSGPDIVVDIDGDVSHYPNEIAQLVVGSKLDTDNFQSPDFGSMRILGFACLPAASTGLDGNHQLHLLADGRTVETRKIDNLMGIKNLSYNGKDGLFLHGCVSGDYLDKRVNEGRTAFNIPEKILKEICRQCVDKVKTLFFPDQLENYLNARRGNYEEFVSRHPIYGFDEAEIQLERVPFHATEAEDFAAGLVRYQIRRDEDRQKAMQHVIRLLDDEHDVTQSFSEAVTKAAVEIHASERLALAQHVVRRKLVLDLLGKMIRRVRSRPGKDDDFHLEKSLHSLIVPMSIRGDNPLEKKSRAHDLWIVDERLSFTRAFSSDQRLDTLLTSGGTDVRADLIVWDLAFGLGVAEPDQETDNLDVSEPLRKVMIVEFKKPGRRDYKKAEDQIENQIIKYLAELKNGEIESFSRENVRIANDCIFYCYVVADIVGDLERQLSVWPKTANGQGRIRPLQGDYRGSIEVVQWQDLINDAWARNQATLQAAGLGRSRA